MGGNYAAKLTKKLTKIMGDRGNIVVRQGTTNRDDVWFYTHWSGYNMKESVRATLARKERWNDSSYLARMVFCDLVGKEHWDGETSFGISTRIGDNSYDIVVVDVEQQRVFLVPEDKLSDGRIPDDFTPEAGKAWTFDQFLELKPVEAE